MTGPRLAVDNVTPLPVTNLMDLAANVRLLADTIENGKHETRSLIIVSVGAGGLSIYVKGENCSPYELMGLFEAAKLQVFADDAIPDSE